MVGHELEPVAASCAAVPVAFEDGAAEVMLGGSVAVGPALAGGASMRGARLVAGDELGAVWVWADVNDGAGHRGGW